MSYREKLLHSYRSGNFLQTIYECSLADNDRSAIALDIATLHNEGLIDVIQAFKPLKEKMSNQPDFFLIRQILEHILPSLDASISSVMPCVLKLYQDAGQDWSAGSILNSFIGFCQKDPSRPREALAEIEANPEFTDLLVSVLVAGHHIDNSLYLTQAIRLCNDTNIEMRRSAIFSLGRFKWQKDVEGIATTLDVLNHLAKSETDDQILANTARSAFSLLQYSKAQESNIIDIISTALSKGDQYTLHVATEMFGLHTNELPTHFLDTLFAHFVRIKPTNNRSLSNVDYGIAHLLNNGNVEKAIQFLENLLLAHPDELTIEGFSSSSREILSKKTTLNKIATRWFLRGNRALGESVKIIISKHHGSELVLEIDPTELGETKPYHILFIARKAIGYLFSNPISAVSFLISLMHNATNDEVLMELGSHLFNPLLINFPYKTKKYITEQYELQSSNVKLVLDQALSSIDIYLENLHSVGNLVALHPSEMQREAYHRHVSNLITESFKKAEEESVVLSLISRSVLLYGNKSIDYVYGFEGQSRRTEIPLNNIYTETDIPTMMYIDPAGLDYMLRVFKMEAISI